LEQFSACWEVWKTREPGNAGLHDFHELLVIGLCAVLCGGQGAVDMALFAKAKESFLRGFLKLENGVPSHDTFSRHSASLIRAVSGGFSAFHGEFLRTMSGCGWR